jgi:hypothetical protein
MGVMEKELEKVYALQKKFVIIDPTSALSKIILMSPIKHYDINTPEEFIDAWEKLTPQIFAKAKDLNIILENEDGTPMDSFNFFLTGETTAVKLNQVGVDKKTAERTLQLATEIQNIIIKLRKNAHPKVTLTQIKEVYGDRHLHDLIQKKLEEKACWVVIASLAWNGYSHDGRGLLYINELPPQRARYFSLKGSERIPDTMKELHESVTTYDPAKELMVVVGFSHLEKVYVYKLSQKPYPPKAYEKRRHVFR